MLALTWTTALSQFRTRLRLHCLASETGSSWSREEQLRGAQDPTHLGRVLQDLGTGFIAAQSPQAKGRIERLWGTLQDRLVSELRTRGIGTLAVANAFLPAFLADFGPRFRRVAADPTPAWRPPHATSSA